MPRTKLVKSRSFFAHRINIIRITVLTLIKSCYNKLRWLFQYAVLPVAKSLRTSGKPIWVYCKLIFRKGAFDKLRDQFAFRCLFAYIICGVVRDWMIKIKLLRQCAILCCACWSCISNESHISIIPQPNSSLFQFRWILYTVGPIEMLWTSSVWKGIAVVGWCWRT